MKELDITESKARKLVKRICEDFEIPPCAVYFQDLTFLGDTLGLYEKASLDLIGYMLVERKWSRRLLLVLHEITHHIQAEIYGFEESNHGYGFQLAKRRIANWADKNISDHFDWVYLLTAKQRTGGYKCRKKKKKKKKI